MFFNRLIHYGDMFAAWVLCIIIATSMGLQFILHELPCPLCLLQRAGLIVIALALAFNLKFGRQARHYGFVIIASLLTGAMAIRQVLLHIVPGTGSYGFPVFGFSLYVWMVVITCAVLVYSAFILIVTNAKQETIPTPRFLCNITLGTIVLLAALNTVLVLFECGWHNCPDNPTMYWLIKHFDGTG